LQDFDPTRFDYFLKLFFFDLFLWAQIGLRPVPLQVNQSDLESLLDCPSFSSSRVGYCRRSLKLPQIPSCVPSEGPSPPRLRPPLFYEVNGKQTARESPTSICLRYVPLPFLSPFHQVIHLRNTHSEQIKIHFDHCPNKPFLDRLLRNPQTRTSCLRDLEIIDLPINDIC